MASFIGIRTRSGAIVQPPGDEVIHKFDFAFNTPGLTTGVTVLTPTAGDILVDCWVEIDTAFNGTTPKIDVSDFGSGNTGWFVAQAGAIDATVADSLPAGSTSLVASPLASTKPSVLSASAIANAVERGMPGRFVNSNPIKLVCTQNGQKGGAATGATQGSGTVYFLTGNAA